MLELKQRETFLKWRTKLKDERARALMPLVWIVSRMATRAMPNRRRRQRIAHPPWPGLPRLLSEARNSLDRLLCGGDKNTQAKDIKTAKRLANKRSE
jgi:putative component of toxin-antitoxin plasmid stabilization module